MDELKRATPQPPAAEQVAPNAGAVVRHLSKLVAEQAAGFSIAYLVLGLAAEVLRRLDVRVAGPFLRHLDGLPYFVLREVGLLEVYLTAVAQGRVSPFWNRALLAGISVTLIWLLAAWTGVLLLAVWRLTRRRPAA